MSENENLINAIEASASGPAESEKSYRPRRLTPALIGGLLAAAASVAILLYWLLAGGGTNAGRPVPPPRNIGSDTAAPEPAAGQTLTISPEQLKNAGITIETIGEQLTAESGATAATGVIEPNAYRQTPAIALVGGIVRRVVPELGDNVRAGQTVAVIFSDEYAQTQSRYVALRTEVENARRNYERTQRLVTINAPGRAEIEEAAKLRKDAEATFTEMRARYERTTRLIQIGAASREELEQDHTKLHHAESELEQARLREQRAAAILPISPEVRSANEEALNKLRGAETELAAVRQRLILFGMSSVRVDRLASASQVNAELVVPAPVSGTITGRTVNSGEVIDANKEILRITDLSSVWVIAQVFERDAAGLQVGGPVTITSDALPDRVFRGQIAYIDPQLDEATRTAKVRVELGNPGGILKIGMYVRVALSGPQTGGRTMPVVPVAAVQTINDQQMVFAATADPNTFELRPVRLGSTSDGRVPVLEGLTQGERVVTNGSFMLRAEWLKSQQAGTGH